VVLLVQMVMILRWRVFSNDEGKSGDKVPKKKRGKKDLAIDTQVDNVHTFTLKNIFLAESLNAIEKITEEGLDITHILKMKTKPKTFM